MLADGGTDVFRPQVRCEAVGGFGLYRSYGGYLRVFDIDKMKKRRVHSVLTHLPFS